MQFTDLHGGVSLLGDPLDVLPRLHPRRHGVVHLLHGVLVLPLHLQHRLPVLVPLPQGLVPLTDG